MTISMKNFNYNFVFKVLESCETTIQLEQAFNWALNVISHSKISDYSKIKCNDEIRNIYTKKINDFIINDQIIKPHLSTGLRITPELLIIFKREIDNCSEKMMNYLKMLISEQTYTLLKNY